MDFKNVWAVESLDDFTFYHCPECSDVCQAKQDFIDHAFYHHPHGAQSLYNIRDASLFDVHLPEKDKSYIKEEIDVKPDIPPDGIQYDEDPDDEDYEPKKSKPKSTPKCQKCKEDFKTVQALQDHVVQACSSHDEDFNCNKCSTTWKSCHVLKVHLEHDHGIPRPAVCETCGSIFPAQKQLAKHKRTVHKTVDPEDEQESSIEEHQPSSSKKCKNKGEFICNLCCSSFMSQANLELHQKKKHEVQVIKCLKCSVEFESVQALNEHVLNCCKEQLVFQCNKCDSKWNACHVLTLHLELEHGIHKPAVCDVCGIIMTHLKHLQRHKKYVHAGFKNICHLCGQGFSGAASLREHIERVHEGTYKYLCDQCSFRCMKQQALAEHVNSVHSKNVKFKCPHCEFSCYRRNARDNHVRIVHKKHKPYKCDVCQDGFVCRRDLQNHQARKHNIGQVIPQKNYKRKRVQQTTQEQPTMKQRQLSESPNVQHLMPANAAGAQVEWHTNLVKYFHHGAQAHPP